MKQYQKPFVTVIPMSETDIIKTSSLTVEEDNVGVEVGFDDLFL